VLAAVKAVGTIRDAVPLPGDATQALPPKPVATTAEEPNHVARVTSVQEDEPGVLPVPLAQLTQAADVVAVAPPREYVLEPQGSTPVPEGTPGAPPGVPVAPASQKKPAGHSTCSVPPV